MDGKGICAKLSWSRHPSATWPAASSRSSTHDGAPLSQCSWPLRVFRWATRRMVYVHVGSHSCCKEGKKSKKSLGYSTLSTWWWDAHKLTGAADCREHGVATLEGRQSRFPFQWAYGRIITGSRRHDSLGIPLLSHSNLRGSHVSNTSFGVQKWKSFLILCLTQSESEREGEKKYDTPIQWYAQSSVLFNLHYSLFQLVLIFVQN